MPMSRYLLTSESVTEGHPDKVCDQISDRLLDCYLTGDKDSHVAIETMVSKNVVFVAGEVTSNSKVDVEKEIRNVLLEIGYDSEEKGMDGNTCLILMNLNVQSADINMGVSRGNGVIGAGDQGMMYGFACDETDSYMPLSIDLAHQLTRRLARVRKEKILPYLYPDGKAQVTVAYNEEGHVKNITDIVVSAQHAADIPLEKIRADIKKEVIDKVIPSQWMASDINIHINPTGRFVIGGPLGDTGVTGRKLMVDTYGGIGKHGGGAFSGKDPTKVDRSSAYMARYAAKNIVAAGLCKKCEVSLAYAIGIPKPVAVRIDTFGTEVVPIPLIEKAVDETLDFSVAAILKHLSLSVISYRPVAAYGHFGRRDITLPWELTDIAMDLKDKVVTLLAEEIKKLENSRKKHEI